MATLELVPATWHAPAAQLAQEKLAAVHHLPSCSLVAGLMVEWLGSWGAVLPAKQQLAGTVLVPLRRVQLLAKL